MRYLRKVVLTDVPSEEVRGCIAKLDSYVKGLASHSKEFKQLFFQKALDKIQLNPAPPQTEDFKILEQFPLENGIVCAIKLTWADRLVYEYYPEFDFIVLTNCLGHKYCNKSYSEH